MTLSGEELAEHTRNLDLTDNYLSDIPQLITLQFDSIQAFGVVFLNPVQDITNRLSTLKSSLSITFYTIGILVPLYFIFTQLVAGQIDTNR